MVVYSRRFGGRQEREEGRAGQLRANSALISPFSLYVLSYGLERHAARCPRTETGARSQLRLLMTTERPRSRRWEEGEAAMVQYGSGLGMSARTRFS